MFFFIDDKKFLGTLNVFRVYHVLDDYHKTTFATSIIFLGKFPPTLLFGSNICNTRVVNFPFSVR